MISKDHWINIIYLSRTIVCKAENQNSWQDLSGMLKIICTRRLFFFNRHAKLSEIWCFLKLWQGDLNVHVWLPLVLLVVVSYWHCSFAPQTIFTKLKGIILRSITSSKFLIKVTSLYTLKLSVSYQIVMQLFLMGYTMFGIEYILSLWAYTLRLTFIDSFF